MICLLLRTVKPRYNAGRGRMNLRAKNQKISNIHVSMWLWWTHFIVNLYILTKMIPNHLPTWLVFFWEKDKGGEEDFRYKKQRYSEVRVISRRVILVARSNCINISFRKISYWRFQITTFFMWACAISNFITRKVRQL